LERKKNVSIIDCECLIAQTGSILVSEATAGSRAAYSFADTLLIFARPSQFVAKMKDAFALMKEKYADNQPAGMTIISGASRSTDIDNTLVIGAFGCKQIALFLVE
jgi:L-lactate dehydrogenase complex protein LldG